MGKCWCHHRIKTLQKNIMFILWTFSPFKTSSLAGMYWFFPLCSFFSGASSGSNWWSPQRVKRCAGDNHTGSQVRPSAALKRRVQRRARQLRDQTLACSGMHPLIYEYQMIIVMITMQLLVTISVMTRLFRGGENLTLALETRLAQLREPFTFGWHRLHQCSVAKVDCWTQSYSLSGGRATFTEGRIQLWQQPTTVI